MFIASTGIEFHSTFIRRTNLLLNAQAYGLFLPVESRAFNDRFIPEFVLYELSAGFRHMLDLKYIIVHNSKI